jgi:hypothetical protein
MDDSPTVDDFVDSLSAVIEGDAGSSPEPETPEEVIQSVPESVAPTEVIEAEPSPAENQPIAEAPAPALDPAIAARLEAMEAQLQEASAKANQFDELQKAAQAHAEQQRIAAQRAEWEARALSIENINDPDVQKREAQRLVAEVEQARNMDAARAIQSREQIIQERELESEKSAAIGAALYQSIQNHPALTDDIKRELIENSRHLSTYTSPAAQQAAIQREQQIVSTAIARAKAEWEKSQTAAVQAKVQNRIAADTDLVGSATGTAGGRIATNDDFVDSIFR